MRSFLNIIDLASGRQIRAAEFGFYADRPSFRGDGEIVFYRSGKLFRFSLETGEVVPDIDENCPDPPADGEPRVYLNYKSDLSDNIAYVELICEQASGRRILARFMGGDGTLGVRPFNSDHGKVVFFGYPSEDDS